jgi:hypothetical protein
MLRLEKKKGLIHNISSGLFKKIFLTQGKPAVHKGYEKLNEIQPQTNFKSKVE